MDRLEKFKSLFEILNKLLWINHMGYTLLDSESLKGKNLVIYGYGEIGKRVKEELELNNGKVKFVIDQSGVVIVDDIYAYTLLEDIPSTEGVVIICAPGECEDIKEELKKKGFREAYTISNLIDQLEKDILNYRNEIND